MSQAENSPSRPLWCHPVGAGVTSSLPWQLLGCSAGPSEASGCIGSTESEGGCLPGATPLSFPERRTLCRSFKGTRSVEGTRLRGDPVPARGPPGFRLSVHPPDQLTFCRHAPQVEQGETWWGQPRTPGRLSGGGQSLSPPLAAPASSRHVGSAQDQCHPGKVPFLAMVEPLLEREGLCLWAHGVRAGALQGLCPGWRLGSG